MANSIYIPELNPVIFYDRSITMPPIYSTKYLGDYSFSERLYDWQYKIGYMQCWQTTDIIHLQFISTFDPIIVQLCDADDRVVIELESLVGLPNKFIPGTYSFEVTMSMAGLSCGYYYLKVLLGPSGGLQKILTSDVMFISDEHIDNTLLVEYYNSTFRSDVIFETGIKFQFRIPGNFGFLKKKRSNEIYRDEKYSSTILSSKAAKQWPLQFGNEFGLPDEVLNLLDEIWSCDHVSVDDKLFGIASDTEPEFHLLEGADSYPLRGVTYTVEEGINRNSRMFGIDIDSTKKLMATIVVDASVFGDTSNQGSANTVPVYNIQSE